MITIMAADVLVMQGASASTTMVLMQFPSGPRESGPPNVSRTLQNNLAKIYKARNNIYAENFKLKLGTCVQSMALGTRTKFQLEILIRSMILVIYKFLENILESSRNVSETPPWIFHEFKQCMCQECISQVLWLISNDVVQKQMVYNSLMIHCLIMITGISHENKIWFQH